MKYIHNDIVKTFKVKILCYAERVRDMHDLAKYHPTPSMKGKSADAANLTVHNQEFTDSELRLAIKDRLPSSMQDELEDHPEDYWSLTYEHWCRFLYTIEVKDKRKRESSQIKNITSDRKASIYDSDGVRKDYE